MEEEVLKVLSDEEEGDDVDADDAIETLAGDPDGTEDDFSSCLGTGPIQWREKKESEDSVKRQK
jgi:hypothetical protein